MPEATVPMEVAVDGETRGKERVLEENEKIQMHFWIQDDDPMDARSDQMKVEAQRRRKRIK